MSIHQTAIITVDGVELQSLPGTVSFKPGLTTATPRMGPRGYVGSGQKPNLSELSCDVVPLADFDPNTMAKGKEMVVRVSDVDAGAPGWIVPRMVLVEDMEFSEGEDSKWSISLKGQAAERE